LLTNQEIFEASRFVAIAIPTPDGLSKMDSSLIRC